MRAGAIGKGERSYDEVSLGEAAYFRANVLDNADELVPDRTNCMGGFASVVPEVGAADTPQQHADDSIRRCVDHGVWPLNDFERSWA
jgi:hypothetical protein